MDDDIPDASVELDTRGLKAFITVEDGDLVLRVHDGSQCVTFEQGAGDSAADAIRGAEHLADMAIQFASLLKVRAGSRSPLTRLDPPPAEVEWWVDAQPPQSACSTSPNINTTQPVGPTPNAAIS